MHAISRPSLSTICSSLNGPPINSVTFGSPHSSLASPRSAADQQSKPSLSVLRKYAREPAIIFTLLRPRILPNGAKIGLAAMSQSLSVPASLRTHSRPRKRVSRLFGDLKVRLKLMVLHNVFFLILAIGVYFALYPYLPDHAKTNLFIVLGAIYVLAVLVLETTIMPLYVYRPLQLMLDADQATQRADHERELIDEAYI